MSELLKKSASNFKSANILITKFEQYAPSIHCSYYSSLQIIIFLINNNLKKEWEKFRTENSKNLVIEKKPNEKNKPSAIHNLYISFLNHNLIKIDYNLARELSECINVLKDNRVMADYQDLEIFRKKAIDSYDLAKNINEKLKKQYTIL
jgi:hypothetical protein